MSMMTPRQGKILFLKKRLANTVDVKIHLDLYVHTSYADGKMFKKNFINHNHKIENKQKDHSSRSL